MGSWRIELGESARRDLKKLEPRIARRIIGFLHERVAALDDPRSIGEPLKGALESFWRFRVGDWRVIARVEDKVLRVFVVRIGHRREIYKRV
jgi:mRNA interferase RelE/StbE